MADHLSFAIVHDKNFDFAYQEQQDGSGSIALRTEVPSHVFFELTRVQ
jgi:hypothetical protein